MLVIKQMNNESIFDSIVSQVSIDLELKCCVKAKEGHSWQLVGIQG